ncbi:MAG: metallophosphoesterase, partial [Promethearchaeota archaeon]
MINNNFLKKVINDPDSVSELGLNDISIILKTAKNIFEEENILLEISLDDSNKEIYVIGDIHGNLSTLLKLIEEVNEKKPEKVIFLGDIVDRGPKQLECLLFVLALKILEPQKYFLLRGNHETLEMNQYYGFAQEFMSRIKNMEKFNEILEVYNMLPLCALINRTILCLHGGIPQDLEILNKLRNVKTKDLNVIFDSVSQDLVQIMWNDPKTNLRGFTESFRGPGIKFFGEDVFEAFLNKNKLKYVIRAHECFPEGYRWFFHNRLLSIFSSANYRGTFSPNPASYVIIRNGEVIP